MRGVPLEMKDMIEVRQEQDSGVTTLQMRHGKVNALDTKFCHALTASFKELQTSDTKAVIMTGTGTTFSAGVDLLRMLDGGADYAKTFAPAVTELFEVVFDFPKPVIAAVNGHAIAGGCVLACVADHRIMASGSWRLDLSELLVGMPYPTVAVEIMRLISPPQYFQELIYSGATVLSEEALKRGLVNELVESTQLMDRARSIAQHYLTFPPPLFALTKRQIRQPVRERDPAALEDFAVRFAQLWADPETHAAIRAYAEQTFKKL